MIPLYKQTTQMMRENPTQVLAMQIKAKSNELAKAVYRNPKAEDVAIIIPNTGGNTLKNPRDVILYRSQSDHPTRNKTVRISLCEDERSNLSLHGQHWNSILEHDRGSNFTFPFQAANTCSRRFSVWY